MKKFTTTEVRNLLNQVMREDISFSEMVEIMSERVSERVDESEVSEFKDGDFLHSDWENENLTLICKDQKGDKIYNHAYKCNRLGVSFSKTYWSNDVDFRPATEVEKQEMLDAIAKEGKRWNAEKLCIEDIPAELKKGDLAIFWEEKKKYATIRIYDQSKESERYVRHKDNIGSNWANAIKFKSKKQYIKLLKGEI